MILGETFASPQQKSSEGLHRNHSTGGKVIPCIGDALVLDFVTMAKSALAFSQNSDLNKLQPLHL